MFSKLLEIHRKEEILPLKKNLDNMLQASQLSIEQKFNNIMRFAKEILDDESIVKSKEHPIFDFIRILGRGIQSDYMKYIMYYECDDDSHNVPRLDWSSVGFDQNSVFVGENGHYLKFYDMKKKVNCKKKINLSKELILPWPWNRSRLINTIKKIGQGRLWGEWKQDYYNHFVEVWLPIGVVWVNGGNHSITIGIIQGGELVPNYYYDISEAYKYIKCDGKNYIRNKTDFIIKDKIIAPVTNAEFAAIFEIGRLLIERRISFTDKY